jgi:hypothetical protein
VVAAIREVKTLRETEAALMSRHGGLEQRRTWCRRAIGLETPRVRGLEEQIETLDAEEQAERAERASEAARPLAAASVPVAGAADPDPEPAPRLRDRLNRFAARWS